MISVVIPLYNKEKSINNTVQSALQQSYKQFELIIVNDGSTDKSLESIQHIKDERMRLINKTNGGVSSARNRGIKESKYNYIAFLDGDDIWSPDHLETIHDLIVNYPDPIVGMFATRFTKIKKQEIFDFSTGKDSFLVEDHFNSLTSANELFSTSAFAIRKDIIHTIGYFDETLSYGEDVEFWHRLFKKYKLVMSNNVTIAYRIAAENRSVDRYIPLEKRYHKFNYKNISKSEKRYLDKLVALLLLDYGMQKEYKLFLTVLKMYFHRIPFVPRYYIKMVIKKIRNGYSI